MYETIEIALEGIAPLMMRNGQLADPLHPIVQQMAEITSKPAKKKTEADHEELSRLEFLGSLYLGDDGPAIPGDVVESWIREGARAQRKGKDVEAGLFCGSDSFSLIYDGPRDPDQLWQAKRFVDRRGVKVQRSRVMRTRPIFKNWSCLAQIEINPSLISRKALAKFLADAGQRGICEYRPRFGRCTVEIC